MHKIYKFKLYLFDNGQVIESDVESIKWSGLVIETVNGIKYDPEHQALVQFSNCFDKKGLPIFQGSILKSESGLYYEVITIAGNFAIVVNEEVIYLIDANTRAFEIAGNVFENKELVEPAINEESFINKINEK